MVKVINISKMTVDVIGVKIKPKKIHVFEQVSMYERAKIASLCAVGKIRAYEIEDETIQQNNNTTRDVVTVSETNVPNNVPDTIQETETAEIQGNESTEEPKSDEPTTTTTTTTTTKTKKK